MAGTSPREKPLILISNDDGIQAPGIQALTDILVEIGECYVIAPHDEQSGVSHAITIRHPVRARAVPYTSGHQVVSAYAVGGTPVDCVKLAVDQLLPRTPDLVVSGINQGPNAAINTIYSGTVSAALEGAILGINSIAFSLSAWNGGDFYASRKYIQQIVRRVLNHPLPEGVLLNVNIPDLPEEEIKGIAVTRQAESRWQESFVERIDPTNQPYYWITGEFVNLDKGEHTDLDALENGWISVTPIRPDLTAHDLLDSLRDWME
jgi:5'-nucleotidase